MRQRVFTTYLGGRGGSAGILLLSSYNCESVVVTLYKIDAGSVGQLFAINYLLKPFVYDTQILHNDVPNAAYLWLPPDGLLVAHETRTGAVMTVGGAGTGIIAGNAGAARYNGKFGMLQPTNSATVPASGLSWITASENSGQSWSWEAWLFRNGTAANNVYFESNVGSTVFASILINASGTISMSHSGVAAYTSAYVLPLSIWTHVGLSYSAGGGTLSLYVNGALQGVATAYARTTYAGIANVVWNANPAAGAEYVALGAVYNVALGADDFLRHYTDLTTDTYIGNYANTAANIAQGKPATALFSNNVDPGFDATSVTMRMPLSPLLAMQNVAGIFYVEALFNEHEE